jgi:hypothetical protein
MDEHDIERMLPGWQATSEAVARELVEWREAHPRASLTQIEDAVFEAMQRLQARALQQGRLGQRGGRCGGTAGWRPTDVSDVSWSTGPRGRQRRTIRPARQRAPLEVDRSYAVCAECGAGLFPPG